MALCALGCGSSGSTAEDAAGADQSRTPDAPESSESSVDGPACDTVWQVDKTLPRTYQGCVDAAGALERRNVLGCSSGQRLVSHDDRYWAVLGGTIHEASTTLARDPEYRTAVRSCRA